MHAASIALVESPLAFVDGVLPVPVVAVGVAQIHGCVCVESSTGPPIGALVIVNRALPNVASLGRAVITFAPFLRFLTTPSRRPLPMTVNVEVMSAPSRSTRRLDAARDAGMLICTNA